MFTANDSSNMIHHLLTSTSESPLALPFIDGNNMTGPYSNHLHGPNGGDNHHHHYQESGHSSNKSIGGGSKNSGIEDNFYKDLFTIMCYSLIILVSLCGNSLVLKVIASRKKLQTTTNILIASLAFADVLTTTLNVPFNVARFLSLHYPFGALFCKLVPFIQVCCVYVSTLTMGVIAIHRHITLSYPRSAGDKSSRSGATCRLGILIVIVWLIAAILAMPHSMFNQIVHVPYRNVTYTRCRAEYPKFGFNIPFWLSVEAFLTQYLIPLSITCTLYIKIGFVVSKQGRLASNSNNRRKKEQDDARRRRIVMLALVVLVFALCWFPLNVYHLLVDFRIVKPNFTVFLVCHWIAMSSVCYNPFIYCWLNESFRKSAIKMLGFLCVCCRKPDAESFTGSDATQSLNNTLLTTVNNNNNNNGSSINLCGNNREYSHLNNNSNNSIQVDKKQQKLQNNECHQHAENCCPKAIKTANNCKKEKRKFRKLRLSSLKKNQPKCDNCCNNVGNNNQAVNCVNLTDLSIIKPEVSTTISLSGGTMVTTVTASLNGDNRQQPCNNTNGVAINNSSLDSINVPDSNTSTSSNSSD